MYTIDTTVILNGALVRTLRHRLQMTQAELGLAVGMFQQHISELERGVARHVYPTTLTHLALALGVEVNQLLVSDPRLKHLGLPLDGRANPSTSFGD